MSLILLILGCVFLFEPSSGLIDVLPDFIGVLLIVLGMRKLADIEPHISTAYGKMKKAMWVTLAKLICMIAMGFLDTIMALTFAFVAGVLECVFMIPAFMDFFDGIDALAAGRDGYSEKRSAALRPLTVGSIVLHSVAMVVPGISAMLFETSGGSVTSYKISPEMLRAYLTFILMLLAALCGAAWLYLIICHVVSLKKDKELIASLEERYKNEILSNGDLMLGRNVKNFTTLLIASLIPFVTLSLDGVLFMPEFLFGILMIIACAVCGDYGKNKKMKVIFACFSVMSVAQYVVMIIYMNRYGDMYMPFDAKGFIPVYIVAVILSLASYVLLALSGGNIASVMKKMSDDSVGLRGNYNGDRRRDIDAARKKSLRRRITGAEIMVYIYSAASFFLNASIPFFDGAWIIRMALGIITVVFVSVVAKTIVNEAENAI